MKSKRLQTFDSDGAAYDDAFRVFLKHTNQKARAQLWLDRFVKRMPSQRVFIDVGAGEGTTTGRLMGQFAHTIAIEPNKKLSAGLRALPGVEVVERKLGNLGFMPQADLVLCSHVFYLVKPSLWLASIQKMASWLAEGGTLVIINQSQETDSIAMSRHFYGNVPHPSSVYGRVKAMEKKGFKARVETVPAYTTAPDLDTAYKIAEFLLGGKRSRRAPLASEVKGYLKENCAVGKKGYRLSCHQDFLVVTRPHA